MSSCTKKTLFELKNVSGCGHIGIKDRVQVLLMRKGISQNELADEIGINKGTLSKILNGHWGASTYIKIKMAQILEVDSLVIFGETGYWKDYVNSCKHLNEVGNESD